MQKHAMRRLRGPLTAGLLMLTPTLSAAAPPVFVLHDLGVVDGETESAAWYINQNGQVTGMSGAHVFSWTESDQELRSIVEAPATGIAEPGGINDNGQIVGRVYPNPFTQPFIADAFSWTSAGGLVNLGSLGGSYSAAAAVNNSGQVVGQSFVSGNFAGRAFLWTAETGMRDLGNLPGAAGSPPPDRGPLNSDANAINDKGYVVGWTEAVLFDPRVGFTYESRAFLWTEATGMQDLGVLGRPNPGSGFAGSEATAVNDRGQVIGSSSTADSTWFDSVSHAFLWTPGRGMQDLGTLGGKSSTATGLNNNGQVVGWSTTTTASTSPERAFLWTESGGMVALGMLPGGTSSRAGGINDAGHIVGTMYFAATDQWRAVLWTSTDIVDLGAVTGFVSSGANAINDSGQVVGISHNRGQGRATLWRPRVASPTEVAVSGTGVYGGSGTLTATLTSAGASVEGQTVVFSLNGGLVGSAMTDANGVATLSGVSLASMNAGSYPVAASFAGSDRYLASDAQGVATVQKANQSIIFSGAPSSAIVGTGFPVTADATSGLPVTVAAAGACSISGIMVTLGVPPGVCALTADQAGDANYNPAPQATQTTAVIYDFSGFFRPVDNVPTMNGVNAGSSVAVKFSLNGNHTLAVLDGAPASAPMSCGGSAVNAIEEMPATSSSGLSYDASSDHYIYVWKTDKAWGGTCRQLVLRLVDGTIHRANFQLK
jgi:probable HAF family extracellular repeat protein